MPLYAALAARPLAKQAAAPDPLFANQGLTKLAVAMTSDSSKLVMRTDWVQDLLCFLNAC